MKFTVFLLVMSLFLFSRAEAGNRSVPLQGEHAAVVVIQNVKCVPEVVADTAMGSLHHKKENKKLIAAILAFPPFGILGLHRIYLGTEPWVPVVYLCTLGGGMILVGVDFYMILTADPDQLQEYENNDKVFMWMK